MNRRQLRIIQERIKRQFRIGGGLSFRRRRRKIQGDKIRYYIIWLLQILAVILLAFLVTVGYGRRVCCSGASMEETIAENGNVLVNQVTYRIKDPVRNDVVAFFPKGNTTAKVSIKRIVAVPGDTVQISNGRLYVNGAPVTIRQNDVSIKESGRAESEILLGEDEYFLLGDNVNHSEDSRYESIGNVQQKDIIGKVWFQISFKGFGPIG